MSSERTHSGELQCCFKCRFFERFFFERCFLERCFFDPPSPNHTLANRTSSFNVGRFPYINIAIRKILPDTATTPQMVSAIVVMLSASSHHAGR